jgi:hypothetical protein
LKLKLSLNPIILRAIDRSEIPIVVLLASFSRGFVKWQVIQPVNDLPATLKQTCIYYWLIQLFNVGLSLTPAGRAFKFDATLRVARQPDGAVADS